MYTVHLCNDLIISYILNVVIFYSIFSVNENCEFIHPKKWHSKRPKNVDLRKMSYKENVNNNYEIDYQHLLIRNYKNQNYFQNVPGTI